MEILVSPAERPPITALGSISSLPEKLGSDLMWQSPHGLVGVQRKTQMDLIASCRDTRLGMELEQMQALYSAYLIIESPGTYTVDGEMLSKHVQWSLRQQHGVEIAIQKKGVVLLHSRTATETCTVIEHLYKKSQEAEHESSLLKRPGPQRNGWGRLTDRATAIYFLTGIPGVGIELATRIFDHFGKAPIGWTVRMEDFLEIHGIGEKKVREIMKVLS